MDLYSILTTNDKKALEKRAQAIEEINAGLIDIINIVEALANVFLLNNIRR